MNQKYFSLIYQIHSLYQKNPIWLKWRFIFANIIRCSGLQMSYMHTYPTMTKLVTTESYLRKSQRIHYWFVTLLEFCWQKHFFVRNKSIYCIKKYRYRLHFGTQFLILFNVFESLNVSLIKMIHDVGKTGYSRPS